MRWNQRTLAFLKALSDGSPLPGTWQCVLCLAHFDLWPSFASHFQSKGHLEKFAANPDIKLPPIFCTVCHVPFGSALGLVQHLEGGYGSLHADNLAKTRPTSFPCDVCKKEYTVSRSLERHLLTQTHQDNAKLVAEDVAALAAKNHRAALAEAKVRQKARPNKPVKGIEKAYKGSVRASGKYRCDDCVSSHDSPSALRIHKTSKMQEDKVAFRVAQRAGEKLTGKHQCLACARSFDDWDKYAAHFTSKEHLRISPLCPDVPNPAHFCDTCKRPTSSRRCVAGGRTNLPYDDLCSHNPPSSTLLPPNLGTMPFRQRVARRLGDAVSSDSEPAPAFRR